jgi:hypothetical protein
MSIIQLDDDIHFVPCNLVLWFGAYLWFLPLIMANPLSVPLARVEAGYWRSADGSGPRAGRPLRACGPLLFATVYFSFVMSIEVYFCVSPKWMTTVLK